MTLEKLKQQFPAEILQAFEEHGEKIAIFRNDQLLQILTFLKNDLQFELLADLCGVDRSGLGEDVRFEVVYHLYSFANHERLRLRVKVPQDDCRVVSATSLWKSADWMERECWEMFGIRFDGHPNLKHLLLFDGFDGYPLRKDYPIEKRQKIPIPEETPS